MTWPGHVANRRLIAPFLKRGTLAPGPIKTAITPVATSVRPVTPLGPLATMKHAVTRLTQSGRVMGEFERITSAEALRAVTLGAAYLMKLDAEIGSIEAGKFADLAVLAQDPLAVEPEALPGIEVLGTVLGGQHHPVGEAG